MKNTEGKIVNPVTLVLRPRFPEDEARHAWLSMLLDAYHLTDTGIAAELAKEEKRRQRKLGCRAGCANCCIKSNVPVTPLELLGVRWFAVEKLTSEVRDILESQLLNQKDIPHCPFLVNSHCAIYPVRPLACRIFFVFEAQCESPDDIGIMRRDDIWTHSRGLAKRVAMLMLPYFGIESESDRLFAFEIGYMTTQMKFFRNEKWEEVAEKMVEFGKKNLQHES